MIKKEFVGELRNVTCRGYKKRDGSDGVGYSLLIEVEDGSSYTLDTCMEVFNAYSQGKIAKGVQCIFREAFEPKYQYNNSNIYEVVPVK